MHPAGPRAGGSDARRRDAQSRPLPGRRPDPAHEGRGAPLSVFEKKGWYRLQVPEGWEVDSDEDPVAIYHPDGAGALQVTAETPRPLPPGGKIDVFLMLRAFLKQTGVDFDETLASRSFGAGLDRAFYEYSADSPEEGRIVWRSWMATNHDLVVFLTYACREEDQDLERSVVEGIVGSLVLG